MLYLCFIFEPNFSNFSSVQSLSRVRLFATPWIAECQASLSITNSQSSLKLTSFSFCPQSLPASVSFPMTQLFAWGGQSTGVSASASFPPKKSQGWSPSEWTDWSSLQSKGLSRVFSNTTLQKHQFRCSVSSVTQSCPTLCNPMECRMPGFPVHHQLPEFTQTYVHWIGDAIQPPPPLLSPSPPSLNLYQHQSLFKWVSS